MPDGICIILTTCIKQVVTCAVCLKRNGGGLQDVLRNGLLFNPTLGINKRLAEYTLLPIVGAEGRKRNVIVLCIM